MFVGHWVFGVVPEGECCKDVIDDSIGAKVVVANNRALNAMPEGGGVDSDGTAVIRYCTDAKTERERARVFCEKEVVHKRAGGCFNDLEAVGLCGDQVSREMPLAVEELDGMI